MSLNTLEHIPVTPEVAAELQKVADSARGGVTRWLADRVLGPHVKGLLPAGLGLLLIIYVGGAYTPLVVPLLAAATFAAILAAGLAAAEAWRRRIAAAPFIIRERGRFEVGGVFRSRVSGDKTRRSIRAATGDLRLDGADADDRLAALWEELAHRSDARPLEIDYTPNRYLLAVRRATGDTLWSRDGYVAPPAVSATPSVAVSERASRLGRLWPFSTGLVLLAIAMVSLYGFVSQPLYSGPAWAFLVSFFLSTIGALGVLVVGAYRLFVGIGEHIVGRLAGRAR